MSLHEVAGEIIACWGSRDMESGCVILSEENPMEDRSTGRKASHTRKLKKDQTEPAPTNSASSVTEGDAAKGWWS